MGACWWYLWMYWINSYWSCKPISAKVENWCITLADPMGAAGTCPSPQGPDSFILTDNIFKTYPRRVV